MVSDIILGGGGGLLNIMVKTKHSTARDISASGGQRSCMVQERTIFGLNPM